MFAQIFCLIGIHEWKYFPARYSDSGSERLGMPITHFGRTCKHCNISQVKDVHCLGLNPDKYVSTWKKD